MVFALAPCSLRLALPPRAAAEEDLPDWVPIGESMQDPESCWCRGDSDRLCATFGYVEGLNISIEYRYLEGKVDRVPELAAELVRLKVDVLVLWTARRAIRAAKQCDQDDSYRHGEHLDRSGRRQGLSVSLARPGGNVTGHHQTDPRVKRQTAGAAEGSRSRRFPRRCPFDPTLPGTVVDLKEVLRGSGARVANTAFNLARTSSLRTLILSECSLAASQGAL